MTEISDPGVTKSLLQALDNLVESVESGSLSSIHTAKREARMALAVAHDSLAAKSLIAASDTQPHKESLELAECTLTLLEDEIIGGRRRGMAGQTLGAMCSARDDLRVLSALVRGGETVGRAAETFVERVKEVGIHRIGLAAEEFESLYAALCASGSWHGSGPSDEVSATEGPLPLDAAMDIAREYAREHHPDADTVLLCESASKGMAGAHSDIDLVILYKRLESGAWRETESCGGRAVEAFCNDPGTLAYFFREVDAKSGRPTLPSMVSNGIAVSGFPSTLADRAKALAREILDAGPPALAPKDLARRRYAITDLADDLRDVRTRHEMIAIGAALYVQIADFALRAGGQFGASGKGLPAALERMDALLEARFCLAFAALFERNNHAPLLRLADDVLEPHGGPLREGYRIDAPADWRIGTGEETR